MKHPVCQLFSDTASTLYNKHVLLNITTESLAILLYIQKILS